MEVPSVASLLQAVRTSFSASGNVVFGIEDATVSIFGLVFGVAASAANSRVVLLAGSTGAVAAIAIMAGTYLDALPTRGQAKARIAQKKQAIEQNCPSELRRSWGDCLGSAWMTRTSTPSSMSLSSRPLAAAVVTAFELQIAGDDQRSPLVQSLWMFFSDLPFSIHPCHPFCLLFPGYCLHRLISITDILLLLLGVARGIAAKSSTLRGALEMLGIATAAAITGYFIGKLVTL